MLTLRVQAVPYNDAYLAAVDELSAPMIPAGVNVNDLDKKTQRELMKAEMARSRRQRR